MDKLSKENETDYETIVLTLGASEIKAIRDHIIKNNEESKKAYEKVIKTIGEKQRKVLIENVERLLKK